MRDWAALVVGALVYAASAGWAAGRLPATGVPLHFDAAGRVVLVGSRAEVVTLWVGLGVGMLALGVALVLFVRRGPLRIMNIPHRTHWMAIQRQPVVRRMLSADVAGVMGVTIVFLSFVPLWTVQALTTPDRTVAPVLFWGPLAVFAVGVVCWAVWLPLPTPAPVRIGRPSGLFGHTWTVARWVAGEPADRAPITRVDAAEALAGFLRALHVAAPPDAPTSSTRGVPLAGDGRMVDRIADHVGVDRLREVWADAVAAPAWSGAPLWLHGDLHPANVMGRDGTITGVIDFGDLCAGDPATDLSAAWILLPAGAAARFFDAYGPADAATISRARGWAVLRALGLIEIGRNGRLGLPGGKPTWEPAGYATLDRLLTTD